MLGRLISAFIHRRIARDRLFVVRYQLEQTGAVLASLVLVEDYHNAKIVAARFNRIEKEVWKLEAASRGR